MALGLASVSTSPLASEGAGDRDRPAAGGRLIADLSGNLELLGDLWAELPFSAGDARLLFAIDARTSIRRTASLTFLLRDLDYDLQLGWRARRHAFAGLPFGLFAGQRGKERVDADGQAYVRYLALELTSPSFDRARPSPASLAWRIRAGPILDHREVDAAALLASDTRLRLFERARRRLDFDITVEGLFDGDRLRADTAAGPRLIVPAGDGTWASFFLHYQHSRSPLGMGHSTWLAGFEYAEHAARAGAASSAPGVDGVLAAGGGEGRLAGQLLLRVLSPPFGRDIRGIVVIDGNILTADDTGDLYYLYHFGLERPLGRSVAGAYFYHRSNHRLAEPGDRVTSINVAEVGIETEDWHRPGRRGATARWGAVDGRARIGYLIDSAFGKDRRWHVRGGARWTLPHGRGHVEPYAVAEAEAGDVERELYAIGAALSASLDVQLEHRRDDQLFSADRSAWLLLARYGFE